MGYITKNNAFSTLAGSISATELAIAVSAGHGDRFPVIVAPDYSYITFENAAGNIEIVKLTARAAASDVLTIERAQDNTVARAWASGDVVEMRIIALLLNTAIAHAGATANAHIANAITFTPVASIAATNVQSAIAELESEAYTAINAVTANVAVVNTNLTAHVASTSAHTAANIVNTPSGNVTQTNVQSAINQLDSLQTLLKKNQVQYALTTGTATDYLAAFPVPLTSYTDDQSLKIKFHVACAPNATFKASGINPPLNLKMYASDGTLNAVGQNDIPANYSAICLVANGGTDLIVPNVIDTTAIVPITFSTTLTWANAIGNNFITLTNNLTITIPLLSTVPSGETFTLRSEVALTNIALQGTDVMSYLGSDITTLALGLNEEVIFVSYAGKWKIFKNNTTPVVRSWQNLTASRTINTNYTNTFNYEIVLQVFIQNTYPSAGSLQFIIDGVPQTAVNLASPNSGFGTNVVPFIVQVPAGKVYRFNATGYTACWVFQ